MKKLLHILLPACLILVLAISAAAQDSQPPGQATPIPEPLRQGDREAPPRTPTVLETETLPNGAVRTVLILPPVADAYIASEKPDQNFGSADLFLGYNLASADNFGAERILLLFDIQSNIPAGSLINEATLRLHLNFSSPNPDSAMGTVLRRLASPWGETSVTWNTEPSWTDVDATADVGSNLDWYEWPVTDLVADWAHDAYPNNGMEIIGDETVQQRERAFYSRETETDFFPQLQIDYTALNDTEPPNVTVEPLPDFSLESFTVSWSGDDQGPAGIDSYDVAYRVDGGDWVTWLSATTDTSAEFVGEDGRTYQFRARGVDRVGNIEPFGDPEAETTVDTSPPTTLVNPLPIITNNASFSVSWAGDDGGGSGIQYYDVQYRFNGGNWVSWQVQTLAASATFTAMGDGLYEFEARAVDNLGHAEALANQAEASIIVDAQPPFVEPRLWLPFISRPG